MTAGNATTAESRFRDVRDAVVAVLADVPWRTGRKVGRTIYAQFTADPLDSDPLIGVMDYPALASAVVAAHNASLAAAVPVHQQED